MATRLLYGVTRVGDEYRIVQDRRVKDGAGRGWRSIGIVETGIAWRAGGSTDRANYAEAEAEAQRLTLDTSRAVLAGIPVPTDVEPWPVPVAP